MSKENKCDSCIDWISNKLELLSKINAIMKKYDMDNEIQHDKIDDLIYGFLDEKLGICVYTHPDKIDWWYQ